MASVASNGGPDDQRNKTGSNSENPDPHTVQKSERGIAVKSRLKTIHDEMKKQTEIIEEELESMEREYNDLSSANTQRERDLNTKLTKLQARLVRSMEETMMKQAECDKLQERYETLFASHATCASNARTLDLRVSLFSRQKASAEKELAEAKRYHSLLLEYVAEKNEEENKELQRELKAEKARVVQLQKNDQTHRQRIGAMEALLDNYNGQANYTVLVNKSGEQSRSQQTSAFTTAMGSASVRRFRTKQTARKTTGGHPPRKYLIADEQPQSTGTTKNSGQKIKKRKLDT